MHRLTRTLSMMFVLFAAISWSGADDDGRSSQEPARDTTFGDEIEVTVANLDVFVRDRHGRPVEGLVAEDFRVLQDGVEVPISNFSVVTPEILAAPTRASETGNTGARGSGAEAPPRVEPAYVVLYIDNENLDPLDRNKVMTRVQTFVEENLAAPVQMMVVSSRRSLDVRQPFTDDPEAVIGALQSVATETGARIVRDRERRRIFDEMEEWAKDPRTFDPIYLDSIEVRIFKEQMQQQILAYTEEQHGALKDTLASMNQVVRLVAAMSGRRSIVYVSNGLPMTPGLGLIHEYAATFHDNTIYTRIAERDQAQEFRSLADAANRARVSLYTIDAGGLRTPEGFGAEGRYPPKAAASWVGVSNIQEPLKYMADATGGLAVLDTNDVTAGLRLIRDDIVSYYSIGFTTNSDGNDAVRRIEVQLPHHPDYDVRHRKWLVEESNLTTVQNRVLQTLVRDIEQNSMDVQLSAGDPMPAGSRRWQVPLYVSIPLARLDLEPEGGDLVAHLDLFFSVRDERGRESATQRREYEIRIPAADYVPDRAHRYRISVQMLFRKQRHTVAVGLVDRAKNRTSFARTVVDIP